MERPPRNIADKEELRFERLAEIINEILSEQGYKAVLLGETENTLSFSIMKHDPESTVANNYYGASDQECLLQGRRVVMELNERTAANYEAEVKKNRAGVPVITLQITPAVLH